MPKSIARYFLIYCIITFGIAVQYAQAQDFKIDDKKPLPIPINIEKPSVAVTKGANETSFIEGMKFYMIEEYAKALESFEKTLKSEKDNTGLIFQISATYQKLGNTEKAIEYARKAFELEPSKQEYGQMLASLFAKNSQYSEANRIFKMLFDADPTDSETGLDLAATYYSLGKYDEVLKVYQTIEKNMGINPELSHQKQALLLKLGKLNDAIKEGDKLIETDPSDLENYIDQAELLIRNEKPDLAIKYIEKAQKISPGSGQAHILLADLARKKGDFDKMYEQLNLACEDKNLEGAILTKVLYTFIEAMPSESDKEKKLNLVKKIIQNHPNEPRGYLLLGDLLLQNADKKGANENYIKALEFNKNNNELWLRILALDNDLQAFKQANTHSEEAIELYPNQGIFWYYNGVANYMLKNFEKATESLEEAKRLVGEEKELTLMLNTLLGETYNRLGKNAKSDEAFELVLKIDPKNDGVANNYSYFLALRKENLNLAIELASKLVERNPTNSTFLDTYGWVLYVNKNYEKAKEFLEKAYQNNGGKSAVITDHFGDALFQIGEKDKAIEIWKKAAILDKNIKNLEKKIAEGRIIE